MITSVVGGAVGAVVSLGLYLTRNVLQQTFVTATDFPPRRYVEYLPVRSGPGYSYWPLVGTSVGFGVVAGLLLGLVAVTAGVRVVRSAGEAGR